MYLSVDLLLPSCYSWTHEDINTAHYWDEIYRLLTASPDASRAGRRLKEANSPSGSLHIRVCLYRVLPWAMYADEDTWILSSAFRRHRLASDPVKSTSVVDIPTSPAILHVPVLQKIIFLRPSSDLDRVMVMPPLMDIKLNSYTQNERETAGVDRDLRKTWSSSPPLRCKPPLRCSTPPPPFWLSNKRTPCLWACIVHTCTIHTQVCTYVYTPQDVDEGTGNSWRSRRTFLPTGLVS